MEVPRRPQATFTMPLHEGSPAALCAPRSLDEVGAAEDPPGAGNTAKAVVALMMEPPEPEDANLPSQDSFSEDGSVSEETSAEEPGRNREEEAAAAAAAAAERAAQRQLLAVEELVQSERNYLRMLQVSTGTIRSNLSKIQVAKLPEEPNPAEQADERVHLSPAAASSRPGQPVSLRGGRDGRVQPPPQPAGPAAACLWRPPLPADSL